MSFFAIGRRNLPHINTNFTLNCAVYISKLPLSLKPYSKLGKIKKLISERVSMLSLYAGDKVSLHEMNRAEIY